MRLWSRSRRPPRLCLYSAAPEPRISAGYDCSLRARTRPAVLGLAVSRGAAVEVSLDTPGVKEALADPALPKDVHDLKAVLRALAPHSVTLAGVRDDVMLLSYLVNPTHGSHTLPDIAARVHEPRACAPAYEG